MPSIHVNIIHMFLYDCKSCNLKKLLERRGWKNSENGTLESLKQKTVTEADVFWMGCTNKCQDGYLMLH